MIDKQLIKCIWDDSSVIRYVKRDKYNVAMIELESKLALQNLQIKYLLNEIDEVKWSRYVYQNYNKMNLSLLYSDVLDIYLSTVSMFQAMLLTPSTQEKVKEQYCEMVKLCNGSFKSIQEDYGSILHHIRSPDEDENTPPFC
jgi:CII-binding regulator of phage lambda lysogenization HflD